MIWAVLISVAAAQVPVVKYIGQAPDKQTIYLLEKLTRGQEKDSIGIILVEEGYFDNRVRFVGDTVFIEAGRRYYLGDIEMTIVGDNGVVTEHVNHEYHTFAAGRDQIEKVKSALLTPFHEQGYYFASLNTDHVSMRDGKILPSFRLITGPQVSIRRIRFKGLNKSRPEFVQKLSGLKENEPFVAERLQDAIRRIQSGDYLQNDSMPQITPNENYDGVEVLFHLSELKSNRVEMGGGYLPGRGAEKGDFVGRLLFDSKNLFGSGRQISLTYHRKDRASSKVDFRFAQPFFIPDQMEAAFHLSQIDYDSSYYSFTIDGGLSLITRGNTRIGAELSWTRTEPQRASQPPSRRLAGTLRYEIRKLDYVPNPLSGYRLLIGVSYIRRTAYPDSVTTSIIDNESVFEISSDNYFHPGKAIVLRLNLESRVFITSRDMIDFSEQFKLGGYGSLRGYRQDQFAGRRVAMGQAEFRLRPSRKTAAYIFGDIGYIYSRKEILPGTTAAEELTRIGSGIGFFIGSPTARATLEAGWGHDDTFDQGKIHFGLVTLF